MSEEFALDVAGARLTGRRREPVEDARVPGAPLLVALHGGSYCAVYFDVPGFSLLDRAAAAGLPAVALDRPGYRGSTLPVGSSPFAANVDVLDAAITELWQGSGSPGVVLVGHSIGGAISTLLAARDTAWPLLGLALSGVALTVPAAGPAYEEDGPVPVRIDVPIEVRNAAMFGPAGSHADDATERAAIANQPVVYAEVAEMNATWGGRAREAYGRVRVPVHARLGEHDVVWEQGDAEIERLRGAFTAAPSVDVARVPAAGHAIDFHHAGAPFQEAQIAFARAVARG